MPRKFDRPGVNWCAFAIAGLDALPADVRPATLDIATTPLAPAACDVFTPEQLEARIAKYAERAAAGVPLFEDGPREPTAAPRGECFGCGVCATQSEVMLGEWKSRTYYAGHLVETYCPACFDVFGWGDGTDERDDPGQRKSYQKRLAPSEATGAGCLKTKRKRKRLASARRAARLQPDAGGSAGVSADGGAAVDVQRASIA